MKLEVQEGAAQDLKQFNKQIQKQIRAEIEKLQHGPLGENTSLLSKQGLEIFRLKLENSDLNHRVFFDINDDQVIILGVKHRDNAYTPESINKIKSRS